jgi:hypothetical protein
VTSTPLEPPQAADTALSVPEPAVTARRPETAYFAEEPKQLKILWDGELPAVFFANALVGVVDDLGDIILILGQLDPPVLPADPDKRAQELEKLESIRGKAVARVAVSEERARQMIKTLEHLLTLRERWQHDVLHKEANPA